jgi:predicted DNA-binding antitoxin AbrB/MazE fold protein
MSKIIQAIFDGYVLKPDEPLDLPPNSRVNIIIQTDSSEKTKPGSFLRFARSVNIEGPSDWSARIDDYLYGGVIDDRE